MITFAITTTTKLAGLALYEDDKVLGKIHIEVAKSHSTTILEQIECLLKWTGKKLTDIKNVVVSIGPGSFTGVRIAISVIKGIFFGRDDVTFYEVNELDALGYQAFFDICATCSNFLDKKIYALIDSRKEKVYFAAYKVFENKLELMEDYKVAKLDDVILEIKNQKFEKNEKNKEIEKEDKNKDKESREIKKNKEKNKNSEIYMIGDAVFNYREKIEENLEQSVHLFEEKNLKIDVATFVQMMISGKLEDKKTDIFNLRPNYLEKSQAERDKK